MPIKIPNGLPAAQTLAGENIFVMDETRAVTQDIRPLQILVLNLMPTKIETETQLSRLLGNTPLQVELEFLHTSSHESKNTAKERTPSLYTLSSFATSVSRSASFHLISTPGCMAQQKLTPCSRA